MKDEALLNILEETAEKLSIKLSYEDLRKGEVATHGGICILRGEKRIIVHRGLTPSDKVDVLIDILSEVDTDSVHLPPDVRERLSKKKITA